MLSILRKYPILRGMAVYSVLSPAANATQQILDPLRVALDYKECLRFGVISVFFTAPTLYGWMRLASVLIKGNTLKHSLLKAYVEQFTYAPFAYTQFYIGINALECKCMRECIKQLKNKFWPTWKVGFFIWPVIQTLNYKFVPEKNRVPFVSLCAFLWVIFLSYMHNRIWKQASSPN